MLHGMFPPNVFPPNVMMALSESLPLQKASRDQVRAASPYGPLNSGVVSV